MARHDRILWDERYQDPNRNLGKGPSALLTTYAPATRPGMRALELACGLGRNALWLAAQGYTVDAVDISITALRKARAEMRQRGSAARSLDAHNAGRVNFIVADLDHFPLPHYAYDLIVVFRFLDRALFPAIRDRVRPGGLVIYQTLNARFLQKRPETRRGHVLQLGELPGFFPGWDVLHHDDRDHMSAFVGRKPG